MSEKNIDYDALSDRYADPATVIIPVGPARTGEAAAAAGREFAIAEYGSVEAMEREIRRGRPRIGAEPERAATARTVRATLSDRDWEAFEQLRAQKGARQAELVREAVHRYLVEHRAAS
ncbi:hypothetical protein [Plantibacter sp. RU18]|uniref:hypothetical protein n=1 Tax=Plantibacter sp. RU18 TaxID=3158143 RepID=UPI003D35A160